MRHYSRGDYDVHMFQPEQFKGCPALDRSHGTLTLVPAFILQEIVCAFEITMDHSDLLHVLWPPMALLKRLEGLRTTTGHPSNKP